MLVMHMFFTVWFQDYVEDYEINVPFRTMGGLGCRVEAASPGKKKGDKCITAIFDYEGAKVCSEKSGHYFIVTLDWNEIRVDDYDCLVIPGGRSPEYLVMDDKVVALVKEFAEKNKVISAIGQGKWLLAAAGLLEVICSLLFCLVHHFLYLGRFFLTTKKLLVEFTIRKTSC